TPDTYTLSLHDALPIFSTSGGSQPIWSRRSSDIFFVDRERMLMRSTIDVRFRRASVPASLFRFPPATDPGMMDGWEYDVTADDRSEEHTSELQSLAYLV